MEPAIKKARRKWTYADYLTWDDGQRWELIGGIAYCMSPAPGLLHQRVSRILTRIIDNELLDKSCELFAAPFDVRLSGQCQAIDNYIDTVVQPDFLLSATNQNLMTVAAMERLILSLRFPLLLPRRWILQSSLTFMKSMGSGSTG